jgi:hypothetical protein
VRVSFGIKGVCFALSIATTSATQAAETVDCDKKGNDQATVQGAVTRAGVGGLVTLLGNCEGVAISVTQSGLTLTGSATLRGTGTSPVILVEDAGDVTVADLRNLCKT